MAVAEMEGKKEQPTLLEENALQERILISEHQAFFGSGAVRSLQVVQVGFVDAYGFLELLYVLSAAFAKGSLRLPVALFAFLGSSIDLFFRQKKHTLA